MIYINNFRLFYGICRPVFPPSEYWEVGVLAPLPIPGSRLSQKMLYISPPSGYHRNIVRRPTRGEIVA